MEFYRVLSLVSRPHQLGAKALGLELRKRDGVCLYKRMVSRGVFRTAVWEPVTLVSFKGYRNPLSRERWTQPRSSGPCGLLGALSLGVKALLCLSYIPPCDHLCLFS